MTHLFYPIIAYGILLWASLIWLIHRPITSRIHQLFYYASKPKYSFGLAIVGILTAFFGLTYWLGIFGEPSVLTVLLALGYALNHSFHLPYFALNKSAQVCLGVGALLIVLTSLGSFIEVGVDFYHHTLGVNLVWHYVIFALIWLVAMYHDKKALMLGWVCLVGFALSVMQSPFILDYMADVWLFFWVIGFGVRWAWQKLFGLLPRKQPQDS